MPFFFNTVKLKLGKTHSRLKIIQNILLCCCHVHVPCVSFSIYLCILDFWLPTVSFHFVVVWPPLGLAKMPKEKNKKAIKSKQKKTTCYSLQTILADKCVFPYHTAQFVLSQSFSKIHQQFHMIVSSLEISVWVYFCTYIAGQLEGEKSCSKFDFSCFYSFSTKCCVHITIWKWAAAHGNVEPDSGWN